MYSLCANSRIWALTLPRSYSDLVQDPISRCVVAHRRRHNLGMLREESSKLLDLYQGKGRQFCLYFVLSFDFAFQSKPYHYKDRAVLLGDAAHSMVPFY